MATTKEVLSATITRRQVLRYGLGLVGTFISVACTPQLPTPVAPEWRNPTPTTPAVKPTTAPTVKPTPEPLDAQIAENARREVFDLNSYPKSLREKMVNFWLQGVGSVTYSKNNQSYLLSFQPATPDPKMDDSANTRIVVTRGSLPTEGSGLLFSLSGSYNPLLGEGLAEQVKHGLEDMNFEHEGLVSMASIIGLISTGKSLGLNLRFPSEPNPEESRQLVQLRNYVPIIRIYAEAVAEINDYLLTFPLFDKDASGQIVFVKHPSSQKPLPKVSGKVLPEAGLTFIVDQTVGASLRGIDNLDQLAQIYPILGSIPGSDEYLKQIQQHFQNNP